MIKGATTRIGIYGKSGCGKSTLAKNLIRSAERLIVYDPLCEYGALGCTVVTGVSGLLKAAKAGRFRVAYQPGIRDEHPKTLKTVAEAVFLIQAPYAEGRSYPQIMFLIEEMSLSLPNVQNSADASVMQNMANMGRHYGINIIGVSQRPANVNSTFRGCLTECYYFGLSSPLDVAAVVPVIGRENARNLLRLPTHQAFYFKEGQIRNHFNTLVK